MFFILGLSLYFFRILGNLRLWNKQGHFRPNFVYVKIFILTFNFIYEKKKFILPLNLNLFIYNSRSVVLLNVKNLIFLLKEYYFSIQWSFLSNRTEKQSIRLPAGVFGLMLFDYKMFL